MGREELPTEFDAAMSWDELLRALATIEGEDVFLTARGDGGHVRARGLLHARSVTPQGAAYELADDATGTAGYAFLLRRPALERARLLTFDGNDYFRVFIYLEGLSIVLADEDSGP